MTFKLTANKKTKIAKEIYNGSEYEELSHKYKGLTYAEYKKIIKNSLILKYPIIDGVKHKICSVCSIPRTLDNFRYSDKAHTKKQSDCNYCHGVTNKNYHIINKKVINQKRRDRYQENIEEERAAARSRIKHIGDMNKDEARRLRLKNKLGRKQFKQQTIKKIGIDGYNKLIKKYNHDKWLKHGWKYNIKKSVQAKVKRILKVK